MKTNELVHVCGDETNKSTPPLVVGNELVKVSRGDEARMVRGDEVQVPRLASPVIGNEWLPIDRDTIKAYRAASKHIRRRSRRAL